MYSSLTAGIFQNAPEIISEESSKNSSQQSHTEISKIHSEGSPKSLEVGGLKVWGGDPYLKKNTGVSNVTMVNNQRSSLEERPNVQVSHFDVESQKNLAEKAKRKSELLDKRKLNSLHLGNIGEDMGA